MIYLSNTNDGRILYDFEQGKSLEFLYAGTTDYYIRAEVYSNGILEENKDLMFVIDKSNIEVYNAFSDFFNTIKTIALKLKAGERKLNVPTFPKGSQFFNWYDINELYDKDKNQIKWLSEAGNSGMLNLNADTIMFIEEQNNEFRVIFKNDELGRIVVRHPRNVCICKSGSVSEIFPALCWVFDQKLRTLPNTITNEEAKVLKKSRL